MKIENEVITPAYAKQLLEQNCANRRLSEATVDRYAQDIAAERWKNTGDTIKLTARGMLIDGQHRMAAVVKANKSVVMAVARGVDEDAFTVIDTGKARTLSDVLGIQGYQHCAVLAAIARGGYDYAAGVSQRYTPTKAALEAFIQNHPYAPVIAAKLDNMNGLKYPKGPLGSVLFVANNNREYDEEVDQFLEGLKTGEGMWKGDARLTLREWLSAQREKIHGRPTGAHWFGAAAKAWNAYAKGDALHLIKLIDDTRRGTLKIAGFDRHAFADVPDLKERRAFQSATVVSNLPPSLATPPLRAAS